MTTHILSFFPLDQSEVYARSALAGYKELASFRIPALLASRETTLHLLEQIAPSNTDQMMDDLDLGSLLQITVSADQALLIMPCTTLTLQ